MYLMKKNYKLYTSPEAYTNAPISLQVVGRRYNDEKSYEMSLN